MLAQEFAALHQGDGVRVDLGDVVPVFFGQADETVRDAQFVFADNLRTALSQQFVVVEQATCNGVLDGQHADDLAVVADGLEHVFKCSAADQFDVFAFEVPVCCNVVKGTQCSLDGYSFHIIVLTKNPASNQWERDPYLNFQFSI